MERNGFLKLYRQMLLIRRFEEKTAEAYAMGKIGGFLHLYIGEEAVAVGAISSLMPDDHLITHYRDHGYALALGMSPGTVMAELYGKATGCSKGRGGSMHLADVHRHFWGGHAIVGGHLPLAAGLGLACQYLDQKNSVLCIFGEGATNIGEFHESLNLVALWKLPVVFLCQNNLYGMGTYVKRASAVDEIYRKACAYDMPAERVDGMDVLAVREATGRALQRARDGSGPSFIEAMTYRFRGHSMADPEYYRSREEVEEWRLRDPITRFQRRLRDSGMLSDEEAARIEREVTAEVEEAARFAEESPPPGVEDIRPEEAYAMPVRAPDLARVR